MSRALRLSVRLLALAVALAAVAFALANRQPVAVSLAPLPWTLELGLWLLALACFAAGALLGGLFLWTAGHGRRSVRLRRRARELADRLAEARRRIAQLEGGAAPAASEERR